MAHSTLKTIGQLAREFGLSRSTLLYYDRKNLLSPSARSESNYRLYSQKDVERLKMILTYRSGGLSLEEIMKLLTSRKGTSASILASRLQSLNTDIAQATAGHCADFGTASALEKCAYHGQGAVGKPARG